LRTASVHAGCIVSAPSVPRDVWSVARRVAANQWCRLGFDTPQWERRARRVRCAARCRLLASTLCAADASQPETQACARCAQDCPLSTRPQADYPPPHAKSSAHTSQDLELVRGLIATLPSPYITAIPLSEQVIHAHLVFGLRSEPEPGEPAKVHWQPGATQTRFHVVHRNRVGSLGAITSLLSNCGFNITTASVFSTRDGFAVNAFWLDQADDACVGAHPRCVCVAPRNLAPLELPAALPPFRCSHGARVSPSLAARPLTRSSRTSAVRSMRSRRAPRQVVHRHRPVRPAPRTAARRQCRRRCCSRWVCLSRATFRLASISTASRRRARRAGHPASVADLHRPAHPRARRQHQ